jgi:hypothetical protein
MNDSIAYADLTLAMLNNLNELVHLSIKAKPFIILRKSTKYVQTDKKYVQIE